MTIPNLIANTNGAKYRSGFKKAISTLNQAGLMAQAQYDYDYAGTSSAANNCASDHPESDMTMCAIFNGTLTGYTYRGTVSQIKRQANSSAGASATSYTINRNQLPDVSNWHAYSLADGSIVAFHPDAHGCALEIGYTINSYSVEAGQPLENCYGFIDVNGTTLPNKEVRCTIGGGDNCHSVKGNDMTDVFPIVFHDATVEAVSPAAKYVLTTSK